MDRKTMTLFVTVSLLFAAHVGTQEQEATASDGWIALPGDGETSASAYAVVRNPSMYDAYLVSASSEVAEKVEFRDASGDTVRELTVPAYGKLSMEPGEVHMLLVDLKRPLEEGEKVSLTITTDSSIKLGLEAVVRHQ